MNVFDFYVGLPLTWVLEEVFEIPNLPIFNGGKIKGAISPASTAVLTGIPSSLSNSGNGDMNFLGLRLELQDVNWLTTAWNAL